MSPTLRLIRPALEPAAGVVFLLLWIGAEAGRGVENLAVMLLIAIAIGLSGRVPRVAAAIVVAMLALQSLQPLSSFTITALPLPGPTDWAVYFGIALIVLFAGAGGRPGSAVVSAALAAVAAAWCPLLIEYPIRTTVGWAELPGDWLSYFWVSVNFLLVNALAWAIGVAVHSRSRLRDSARVRETLTEEIAQSESELAVSVERTRIAHEVHDIVAHALAVIVAQADGARYVRTSRPERADAALLAIAEAARSALGDVRGLVDEMIDGAPAPQPGVADLTELLASMSGTGLTIEVAQTGEAGALTPAQQLAVYRILQESLTNALRHRGRESVVEVGLDWSGPGLSLTVRSHGGAEPETSTAARPGRGIAGMRERARAAGGWLAASADDDGAFLVTAFVPYRIAEHADLATDHAVERAVAA